MANVTAVNWSNITTIAQAMQIPNLQTGSYFWTFILYGVWIIFLLLFSAINFDVALIASSFIAIIGGIFLVYAGLVAWTWVLPFVGILILMILVSIWSKD